jgi:DNA-binding NarL/FixJ family response regulator
MKALPLGRPFPFLSARFAPPVSPIDSQAKIDEIGSTEEDRQRTRILIVEDDFLIAMQTETALTDAGFEVVGTATTAEEAIALATERRPSLAVMDIRLASARDGIDAAKELFRDFHIRCIFATAHDDLHTRARAEPYAPLGWLAKPYSMTSLVALVMEARSELD